MLPGPRRIPCCRHRRRPYPSALGLQSPSHLQHPAQIPPQCTWRFADWYPTGGVLAPARIGQKKHRWDQSIWQDNRCTIVDLESDE